MKIKRVIARQLCTACISSLMVCSIVCAAPAAFGQAEPAPSPGSAVQQKIQTLTDAVSRVESQLEQSRQELADLRQQLAALRASAGMAAPLDTNTAHTAGAAELAAAVAEIRETQALQEAQIATLDQSKVESASKYPVKLSGMVLVNGFVNTARVDTAATPAAALSGSGSTGVSVRQTIAGLDINGPDVLRAQTHADLRLDMSAGAPGSGYSGSNALGLVRLRTAHIDLDWSRTRAFFALDRPLLSPESPASLTAVALPALAWSGNLWAWNPQAGVSIDALSGSAGALRVQAALIDASDPPPLFPSTPSGSYAPPSTSELSRWPGVEARVAFEGHGEDLGPRFGVSGYFAPHRTANSFFTFDSWAGAADFRIPASRFSQFSGGAYWGSALGSLGAGTYKDFVARNVNGEFYYQALDDRGGWLQWKQRPGPRLEFNEAFGIDNVPAGQLRPYAVTTPVSAYNLARNRTITGNVIYSPSAWLLFSLEYRRILSSYVTVPTTSSDVIGVAAGYRF